MEWTGTNSTRLEITRKNPFFGNNTALRKTRIFNPSNLVNKHTRFFTTTRVKQIGNGTQNLKLNSWFITGFINAVPRRGEGVPFRGTGCFMLNFVKNNKLKVGWRVQPWFKIGLHKKDLHILESIQNTSQHCICVTACIKCTFDHNFTWSNDWLVVSWALC